jgi:hypothetical protein
MAIDTVTVTLLQSVLASSALRNLFIGCAPNGAKYYLTAKGLNVARDPETLPIG